MEENFSTLLHPSPYMCPQLSSHLRRSTNQNRNSLLTSMSKRLIHNLPQIWFLTATSCLHWFFGPLQLVQLYTTIHRHRFINVLLVIIIASRQENLPDNGAVSNYSVKIVLGDLGHCLRSLSLDKIMKLVRIGKGFLPNTYTFSSSSIVCPFSEATAQIASAADRMDHINETRSGLLASVTNCFRV